MPSRQLQRLRPRAGGDSPRGERRQPAFRPRRRTSDVPLREAAFDVLLLILAMIATRVSAEATESPVPPVGWLAAFSITVLVALALGGAYRPRFTLHFLDDLRSVLGATAIAAMGVSFARVLVVDDPEIAGQAVRAWLFAATYLIAGRAGFNLVQARARTRGQAGEATLIVGAGHVAHRLARRLAERPEYGLKPVAFFDQDPLEIPAGPPLPILGRGTASAADTDEIIDRLDTGLRDFGVRHVVLTFSLSSHELELALVRHCLDIGVSVSLVPRLFEGVPDQTRLERIGGIPLISVHPTDPRSWAFAVKYAIDRAAAAAALVLASPLLVLAAIGTWLTLGRPIMFRQRRVGIDGQEFDMHKFRTMREVSGELHARLDEIEIERGLAPGGIGSEDRRTRFGSLLRATSLDELPQFVNVLRGQMSIVGPRPERPEYAHRFDREIHRYGDRHRVKSGITGWAQVHGLRGRTSLADRVEWDNYYIENWSPWLDLKILLLTVVAVFRVPE